MYDDKDQKNYSVFISKRFIYLTTTNKKTSEQKRDLQLKVLGIHQFISINYTMCIQLCR